MSTDINVGVLFVHGIGEQGKFQDLESIIRNIATALQSDKSLKVRIIVNSSDSGAYGATQQVFLADDEQPEPIIIEVTEGKNQQVTNIRFREVWWSDLDEPVNLKTQLAFWLWGLSLWSRKKYTDPKYGTTFKMYDPVNPNSKTPQICLSDRLRFFFVSLVVLLIMPLLYVLSYILRSVFGFNLRPDILIQYLGDVKLYQQEERVGKGSLLDLGQPPRISIRRRMIKKLVQMSLSNYDRWYVLSHSLGTLVAFNGLMETDLALPNYLNQQLWDKWQNFSQKKAKQEEQLTSEQIDNMVPSRPAWLNPNDIVDRSHLFRNLKGFLTYGSPLSKFAVFWPAIVPINKDTEVFSPEFEWINIYDPSDPVADQTKYFQFKTGVDRKQPREIAYKAESLHLVSHGEYLTYNQKRKHPLAKNVADWLLSGDKFKAAPTSAGWPVPNSSLAQVYVFIRVLIWLLLGWVIAKILSWLIPLSLPDQIEKIIMETIHFNFSNPLSYILVAIVIVFITGVIVRVSRVSQKNSLEANSRISQKSAIANYETLMKSREKTENRVK